MKVRDIPKRRTQRAKTVVRRQYGPRCSDYDPYCATCNAHKFLMVHRRVPHIDQIVRFWHG